METNLCIIGFAISGIPVARWAKYANIDFIVLDKSKTFGGVWVHNSYRNIILQTTKYSYAYSDQPMDESVSLHPSREEILAYLNNYIVKHGLNQHVRYQQEVLHVELIRPKHPGQAKYRYRIHVRNHITGAVYYVVCKNIAVCSGIYTTPKIPTTINHSKFRGAIKHSQDFAIGKSSENYNFRNKHVTVIGNGPTGCDLAVNAYDGGAKTVNILWRSPKWLFTRYIGTIGLNFFSNRFFLWVGMNLPIHLFITLLYFAFFLPYYTFGFHQGVDLPNTIVNRHNLTMNEQILRYINSHKINYTSATDIGLVGNRVHYICKGIRYEKPCDITIFATGFNNGIPFLGIQKIPNLYKRMLFPNNDSIALIGFAPSFNWCQVSDIQARWFIKLITGKISLPSHSEREIFMKSERDRYRQLPYEYNDLAYLAYIYCDELANDMDIEPKSKWSPIRWCSVPRHNEWAGF
jgi:dimethylaniline monooxygenase (N-oxide forming)